MPLFPLILMQKQPLVQHPCSSLWHHLGSLSILLPRLLLWCFIGNLQQVLPAFITTKRTLIGGSIQGLFRSFSRRMCEIAAVKSQWFCCSATLMFESLVWNRDWPNNTKSGSTANQPSIVLLGLNPCVRGRLLLQPRQHCH